MKKLRGITALLAAMALVGAGCTDDGGAESDADGQGGTAEQVTLDLWVFEEEDFLPSLEEEFETANPNIDLNITAFPEENYGVKLDTAIAADKAPDLTLYPGPEDIEAGLFLPIDDLLAEKGIDVSTYVPAIVEPGDELSCAWEDHLYCLGTFAGSVQMLYNKDMFDDAGIPYPEPWPPMTPEEFVDIACQLTDEEKGVWGGAAADPTAYMPFDMMISPDGRTAEGYINGPEVVHQVDLLAGAYEQGCVPTSNILDPWAQGRDFFAQEKLAMVITDFQDLPKVEKAGINYGSTAPPTPEGEEPYFFVWTDSVGVIANTEHPDEAAEFVAFLGTEGQRIRYETTGDIPLDLAMAEQLDWAEGIPGREDGLEVLENARPLSFVPERWDAYDPFYDAWNFVLSGEKGSQEALDEVAPAIQENLDEAWEDWEKIAS